MSPADDELPDLDWEPFDEARTHEETTPVRQPGGWRRTSVADGELYDPRRKVEHPGSEVFFPPVPNGLDYLVSVVEHLESGDERVSARDLKYAVLHLAAGAEVLLKARLQLEHWTLVFKDPGQAKRSELEDGTLKSCSPEETVQRLKDIAGAPIGDKDTSAVLKLAKHRNALQHYGLIGPAANARAVESQAAEVLDFLIRFLDEELLPALPMAEMKSAEADMERIRGGLSRIQGFVKKRMQRIRADLEPLRDRTVQCPDCDQWALVPELDHRVICRFCGTSQPTHDGATMYAVFVLGRDPGAPDLFGIMAVESCPDCDDESLVVGARTAAAPDVPVFFCFGCARVVPGLAHCGRCYVPFSPQEGETACSNCLRIIASSD
ncbi:hypothetical protein OG613_44150 (plasmid) [Streptomyces sp. NBC_00015]|uniref:hypothetical protein n=1 Tax=Streptomyces sp. NBC_00015 TaxID=2903611 RepID=UPI002F913197